MDYKTGEIILLASSSEAKIVPTQDSANSVFGSARVIAIKSESGVSDNPYGAAETIEGALNRLRFVATGIESQAAAQYLSIESGIFPTYVTLGEQTYLLQFEGIPSTQEVTKAWNNDEEAIKPDDTNATFFDRAVVTTYDKRTNTTFIGISQGVAFPNNAVKKAILEMGGSVRVSEVLQQQLIASGDILEDGTIVNGPLIGQKFDIQDPQKYLTSGEFSRSKQLSQIEKLVFENINKKRAVTLFT